MITEWVSELTGWHWLSLAMVLLIAEMLGAGGFLIGVAIASLVVGALNFFIADFHWHYQLALFSVLAVIFTLFYWKKFRAFNLKSDNPTINDRAAQLIGTRLPLTEPVINGQGRIQIGDTFWKVYADEDIASGKTVEVTASKGMSLKVVELK